MVSLRIEKNRLRFRLSREDMQHLYLHKSITIHNPIGGLSVFVAEERYVELQEGGVYALFIPIEDIENLQQTAPSKEGLILNKERWISILSLILKNNVY